MSHPFNNIRGSKVAHDRVSQIVGRASGGSVKHSDEKADKALVKKMVKSIALKGEGDKTKSRGDRVQRARGGRTKAKGGGKGKTTVNVIVAPSGGQKPPMPGPMAGMGPPPPMAKPPMPPAPPPGAGGAPGMPPGGLPIPMAGRKRGGKVCKADGGTVPMPKARPPGRDPQPSDLYDSSQIKSLESQFSNKGPQATSKIRPERKSGGKVSAADVKGKTGIGERTPIQHTENKQDSVNIGRKPPITRATGGPIYANGKAGAQMGPDLPGGAKGGKGRLEKAHRAHKVNRGH